MESKIIFLILGITLLLALWLKVEGARGCGFRTVGRLYLVGNVFNEFCHRLPLPADTCMACHRGVKFARNYRWIEPVHFFDLKPCGPDMHCSICPVCTPSLLNGNDILLIWVGKQFYKTPEDFMGEAVKQGISRHVKTFPRGFRIGTHWVFLAHVEAIVKELDGKTTGEIELMKKQLRAARKRKDRDTVEEIMNELAGYGKIKRIRKDGVTRLVSYRPGVFAFFRPQRAELIVRESELTDEVREKLAKRGISPVVVPDGDPEHDPPSKRPESSIPADLLDEPEEKPKGKKVVRRPARPTIDLARFALNDAKETSPLSDGGDQFPKAEEKESDDLSFRPFSPSPSGPSETGLKFHSYSETEKEAELEKPHRWR
jgi:hypothetical protein